MISKSLTRTLGGLLFSLLTICAAGDEGGYSAGFDGFRALGLPDSSDAEYVQWRAAQTPQGLAPPSILWRALQLTGNAWKLPPEEGHPTAFIIGHCSVIEADPEMEVEDWISEADFAADLQAVIELLEAEPGEDRARLSEPDRLGEAGYLFLFAAQAHNRGHTEEAGRIVELIFAQHDDPALVIGAAVERLADGFYHQYLTEALRTGDWQRFDAQLAGLIDQFEDQWWFTPLAERVREDLARQLLRSPEDVESDHDLSEADLNDWIALRRGETTVPPAFLHHVDYQLWIFEEAEMESPAFLGGRTGTEAANWLLAMADDPWLLPVNTRHLPGHYSRQAQNREIPENEMADWFYGAPRPATLGEVASALLVTLYPGENLTYDLSQSDRRPAARARILGWVDEMRGRDEEDLLKTYLRAGNAMQVTEAAPMLLERDPQAHADTVVEALVNRDDLLHLGHTLQRLLLQLGEKGGPLVEAVEQQVEQEIQEYAQYDPAFAKTRRQEMEGRVEALRALLDPPSFQELLMEVSEDRRWDDNSFVSQQALAAVSLAEAVHAVLQRAVATEDDATRTNLIWMLVQMPYWHGAAVKQMQGQDAEPEELPWPPPPEDVVLWENLFDRTESASLPTHPTTITIGEAAGAAFELIYAPEGPMAVYQMSLRTPSTSSAFLLNRARERLTDAEDPSPLPSADDIPADRRAELRQTLVDAADATARLDILENLSLAEHQWLVETADEDSVLAESLLEPALRIRWVAEHHHEAGGGDRLAQFVGRTADLEWFEEILEEARRRVARGEAFGLTLQSYAGALGMQLSIVRLTQPVLEKADLTQMDLFLGMIGKEYGTVVSRIRTQQMWDTAIWLVELDPALVEDIEAEETEVPAIYAQVMEEQLVPALEQQSKAYLESVADYLSARQNPAQPKELWILGLPLPLMEALP